MRASFVMMWRLVSFLVLKLVINTTPCEFFSHYCKASSIFIVDVQPCGWHSMIAGGRAVWHNWCALLWGAVDVLWSIPPHDWPCACFQQFGLRCYVFSKFKHVCGLHHHMVDHVYSFFTWLRCSVMSHVNHVTFIWLTTFICSIIWLFFAVWLHMTHTRCSINHLHMHGCVCVASQFKHDVGLQKHMIDHVQMFCHLTCVVVWFCDRWPLAHGIPLGAFVQQRCNVLFCQATFWIIVILSDMPCDLHRFMWLTFVWHSYDICLTYVWHVFDTCMFWKYN